MLTGRIGVFIFRVLVKVVFLFWLWIRLHTGAFLFILLSFSFKSFEGVEFFFLIEFDAELDFFGSLGEFSEDRFYDLGFDFDGSGFVHGSGIGDYLL